MKYETYYLEFINQIEIVEGKVSNKTIISWLETYIDKMTNKELMEIVEDGPPVSHLKDEQINDYKIEMKNIWTLAYFPISKEEQDQKFKEYATFIVQEYISYWLNKNGIITEEEESNDDSDKEEESDEENEPYECEVCDVLVTGKQFTRTYGCMDMSFCQYCYDNDK